MNASDVNYKETGDVYTISYKDDEGVEFVYEGKFDESANSLVCEVTKMVTPAYYLTLFVQNTATHPSTTSLTMTAPYHST